MTYTATDNTLATDTIDYVITNQSCPTSTSTRTVIILPAQAGEAPPTNSASSTPTSDDASTTAATTTDATSTAQ